MKKEIIDYEIEEKKKLIKRHQQEIRYAKRMITRLNKSVERLKRLKAMKF